MVLVVSRDVLIVTAVILSSLMARPVEVNPLFVSKANTACQIALAAVVLAELAFGTAFGGLREILIYGVAALTILSAGAYLKVWVDHMAA